MNSPHRGLTARRRFWVVVFALVSLGVMAGGLAYYRYEQDHIRREKYQELAAIADLKVRQIVEWRRERLDDARSMARDPFLGKAIAEWLRDPGTPGLRAALLERLKVEEEGGAYGNVLLTDPDGRILLSVRPDPAPLSPAGKQALEAAVAGRQAVVGDLFRCPKDDRVHLDVAVSVLDPQGRPLAVAVLRVNPDKVLYPLIQSWPTPSLTAETLLVEVEGKDMLFLNDLRHRGKTALSLREPLTQKDLPAVQAGLGKQGMFEGRDYRGKKVLADLRPVPQSPWFMVAKVDADEILAKARYRAGITALFVVIFILLTAAVTAYGYRQRQANLYQDLYQTEREQRKAQEEFRTTLYSIGDAVITTDTEGLVKHINPVAERLTGWLEAETRGRPHEEVFHILNEETRTPVENPVDRVLREGQVVGLGNHTLLIARDGTESPIADSGAPIRDESGVVLGVVLVFRDQTQEQAAEKALRQSEERFRIAAETANDLIYEWDLKQNLQWSDRIDEMLGYGPAEFPRTLDGWVESVHPEDIDHVKASIKAHLEGRVPYVEEYRIRRKDGVYRWWSARGDTSMSPDGTPVRWIGTATDITARKLAEEALRESEEKFRAIFDNANDGILLLDEETLKFAFANKKICEMLGYSIEEIQNLGVNDIHPRENLPYVIEIIKRHLSGEILLSPEIPVQRKDGSVFYADINTTSMMLAGKRYLLGIFRDITFRKRAEEALRESEARYRVLAENVTDVIWTTDLNLNITFSSPSAELLIGYSFEELQSLRLEQLLTPVSLELVKRTLKEQLALAEIGQESPSVTLEIEHIRKDGSIVCVEGKGSFLRDSHGQLVGILGVSRDLTEHKKAEKAQREHLYFLQTLIDTIPAPIVYKNIEGIYLGCNKAYGDFLGLPKEEIIGKSVYDVFPKDLADKYYEMDSALFRQPGVQRYDFTMSHADGTRHNIILNRATYSSTDGTLAGLVAVLIDITERKRVEEALWESEQKLANIIDFLPDATFVIDKESKVIAWNKAIEEMTGVKAQDILGQGDYEYAIPFYGGRRPILIDLVLKPPEEITKYGEVEREGIALWGIAYIPAFKGSEAYLFGKASVLQDSNGNIVGAIESIRDITEGKRAEAERLRFSKLESLGTLAGGIAHDFNNILTAILGNIGLALLEGKMEGRVQERLAQAEQACLKAQGLSQQLLTFAKGGAPIKKATSLPELCRESADLALAGSKARCDFSLPEDLWPVEVDAGQINQVINNLLINADQAMPEGGRIKVQADNVLLGEKSALPLPQGKYVKLTIADQGIGIASKYLDKIFDPYFTTKQKGSGLGLSTAYSIIKSHSGYLTVESEVGVGTTFEIHLPALEVEATVKEKEIEKPVMGQGRILVMDDEEIVLEVLSQALTYLGYEVELAKDGGQAINKYAKAKESGRVYDGVILDLTVPGGMGGKETIKELHAIDPQVKAIVSSGYSDDPILANFKEYGFSGFIAKPYKVSELSKILHEVIGRKDK